MWKIWFNFIGKNSIIYKILSWVKLLIAIVDTL